MKKLVFLFLGLSQLLSISCAYEEELAEPEIEENSAEVQDDVLRMCSTNFLINNPQESTSALSDTTTASKVIFKSVTWENGRDITVKFLDGSTNLTNKVFSIAEEWENYANINFRRVYWGDADIRISFEEEGSWSYVGTYAFSVAKNEPTMNFGWLEEGTNIDEFYRVVLHEFGHALGAKHEHQNPNAGIKWNENEIYKYYGATSSLDRESIYKSILQSFSQAEVTNSIYDPLSIMHYAIDNRITLDDYEIPWNYELSEMDKDFIGRIYPFDTDKRFPDPTKTYYIQNRQWNVRLRANGSEDPLTAATTATGDMAKWVFTPVGETGYYYIDCVGAGTNQRLRSDQTSFADMQSSNTTGWWSSWKFTYVGDDHYMVTTRTNSNYSRLQVNNSKKVTTVAQNNTGAWTHFKFIEAGNR